MLIAKRFTLAGIPVETVYTDSLVKELGCIGQAHYTEQQVILDPTATPIETTEQAAWHEYVHWILFIQNRHDLRNDEEFVDGFAHLLYQLLKTGGYSVAKENAFKPGERLPKGSSKKKSTSIEQSRGSTEAREDA